MARKQGISKVTIRHAQEALAVLFPSVKCTVAPNGQPEIWVKDDQGFGFALNLSSGKAGVSATLRKFSGTSPITVTGNSADGYRTPLDQKDAVEVSCCVYRDNEYSQAFKRWYGAYAEGRIDIKYPDEIGKDETKS